MPIRTGLQSYGEALLLAVHDRKGSPLATREAVLGTQAAVAEAATAAAAS
jgi:hypothetical protein